VEPELLAIAVLAAVIGLMLSWAVLATVYFLPVRLIQFFRESAIWNSRQLEAGGWRR